MKKESIVRNDETRLVFFAGETLIKLLQKAGLAEITRKRFPDDYRDLLVNKYDPTIHKRAFASSRSFILIFEYGKIVYHDQWSPILGFSKEYLTLSELRSFLVFSMLCNRSRIILRKEYSPFSLHFLIRQPDKCLRKYGNEWISEFKKAGMETDRILKTWET